MEISNKLNKKFVKHEQITNQLKLNVKKWYFKT